MRYHISICDDDAAWRAMLAEMVGSWAAGRQQPVQIEQFESAEELLFKEADKETQRLLLDIEMKKMNGVELAGQVRRENKEMQIVFVTGYMEYIQDGYEVEALHYLLKPVTEEKLFSVLDRAAKRLASLGKSLVLTLRGETVRIPLHEIRYLEVLRNYVTIHGREDYEVKQPLHELEENLDDSFCRTGRSYIVNLRFIRRVTKKEVILHDGAEIPLSKGMYDKVNQAMIRHF